MPPKGYKLSKETKQKIKKNHTRYWLGKKRPKPSKETIRKLSIAMKKSWRNPEFRKKIIDFHTGRPNFKKHTMGRYKDNLGYILIYMPTHPFCNHTKYVQEHRLVMEKHLGRYLKPEEVVHHINGIRNDNRIENLQLFKNVGIHLNYHKNLNRMSALQE